MCRTHFLECLADVHTCICPKLDIVSSDDVLRHFIEVSSKSGSQNVSLGIRTSDFLLHSPSTNTLS